MPLGLTDDERTSFHVVDNRFNRKHYPHLIGEFFYFEPGYVHVMPSKLAPVHSERVAFTIATDSACLWVGALVERVRNMWESNATTS